MQNYRELTDTKHLAKIGLLDDIRYQHTEIIFRDFWSSFFLIRIKVCFGIAFKFVK